MVAPRMNPPRHDSPVSPAPSSDVVVPLRPKPPAYPAVSTPNRPVIIEQDVIDYLVRVPLEQRWRILSRVAITTLHDEPMPASAPPPAAEHPSPSPQTSPPPSVRQPMVVVPAPSPHPVAVHPVAAPPPPPQRPQLELVDQTREALTPPPPPPSASSVHAAPAVPAPPAVPAVHAAPAVAAIHAAPAVHAGPPRPAPTAPPRPASAAPSPSASTAPPTVVAASPPPVSAAPPAAAHAAPPPVAQEAPVPPSAAPQRLAYSAPPPPPALADHAEQLFDAMHELTLHESALSGARFCLQVALAAVPCLAGLVHVRDPKTMELVVVHAQGPRADGLVGTRTPQADALVARAARSSKPTVATYGAEPGAETTKSPRHGFFDPWSVVVVPVVHGGQLLGLLEMIDPIDGNPHDENAQAALGYIATRLGRFLVDHPVAF
jgi:hypothetical protein